MVPVAGTLLAFGTKFESQRVMQDDEMTETAVVKTRLTPGEKEAWQRLCEASGRSESDVLREMIQRVCGESIAEEGRDMMRGPKSCKLSIRLTRQEQELITERAAYEGFPNRTRWASALIRATLLRQPVMNEEERLALIQASFALTDVIENAGGTQLGLPRIRIKGQGRGEISIKELQDRVCEVNERVIALVSGGRKRWNLV
ncbi:hypothetical protein [Halomonas alimentaria]|uniref:Uncharacterized protein n=1 Tax=Halomonas alimentaria TaxID=147248 RepID=A0A7X5AQE0_9GAMM|nr:hypothetical protein [Halomonas alimentaria]NAW34026.1 hypothetical protein [Halomonas alimentaria]